MTQYNSEIALCMTLRCHMLYSVPVLCNLDIEENWELVEDI